MAKRKVRIRESIIQEAVAEHLRQYGVTGMVWWHTISGAQLGGNRFAQVNALKKRGWVPGIPDIFAFHDSRLYCLELKGDGSVSEAQLEFLAKMEGAGAFTAVSAGLDEALKILRMWGLLRVS